VCFQSRLGRTPWIRPFTDELYRTLPAQGVKRVAVLCPSFVADCLETVEEVSLRGRDEFLRHGGHQLFLVPSLNAEDGWVKAVTEMVGEA
jgi:ferrochelatase